jgi:hypothetical protein
MSPINLRVSPVIIVRVDIEKVQFSILATFFLFFLYFLLWLSKRVDPTSLTREHVKGQP